MQMFSQRRTLAGTSGMMKIMAILPRIPSSSINMRKTYMMPAMQVNEAEVINMMAVSLQDGNADPNAEVLTKENADWDLWADSEE